MHTHMCYGDFGDIVPLWADAGVDVLVLQGVEAGGHVRGSPTALTAIPYILRLTGVLPPVGTNGQIAVLFAFFTTSTACGIAAFITYRVGDKAAQPGNKIGDISARIGELGRQPAALSTRKTPPGSDRAHCELGQSLSLRQNL